MVFYFLLYQGLIIDGLHVDFGDRQSLTSRLFGIVLNILDGHFQSYLSIFPCRYNDSVVMLSQFVLRRLNLVKFGQHSGHHGGTMMIIGTHTVHGGGRGFSQFKGPTMTNGNQMFHQLESFEFGSRLCIPQLLQIHFEIGRHGRSGPRRRLFGRQGVSLKVFLCRYRIVIVGSTGIRSRITTSKRNVGFTPRIFESIGNVSGTAFTSRRRQVAKAVVVGVVGTSRVTFRSKIHCSLLSTSIQKLTECLLGHFCTIHRFLLQDCHGLQFGGTECI
mmetsp:Transcript_3861/g.7680  ORF Transcript_3861/g.7680 Transcript_3861/m.7680 type:complete len:274 (-) Transcript_3861:855-1676(-)